MDVTSATAEKAVPQIPQVPQIPYVRHRTAAAGPADLALALAVTRAPHAPVRRPAAPAGTVDGRAAEVSVPQLMGLRTGTARPHRRKVPLHRLTTMRA